MGLDAWIIGTEHYRSEPDGLMEKRFNLGYWRKNHDLHRVMLGVIPNLSRYPDEGYLDEKRIETIIGVIQQYSEEYTGDIQQDIETLRDSLKWLEVDTDPGMHRTIRYSFSE